MHRRTASFHTFRAALVALLGVAALACSATGESRGSGGPAQAVPDPGASWDPSSAPHTDARVVRAGDGDTIDVTIRGKRERVRMLGVDTPELGDSQPAGSRLAREAAAFTSRELVGKDVRLVADPLGENRDKYGRLLRYVTVDGRNFNEILVREGYACVYRVFDYTLKEHFLAIQEDARREHPDRDPCADRRRRAKRGGPLPGGDDATP